MGLPPIKEKNFKPQNVGSTPPSLVIFQCGIASHKRKKNPKPQNLGSTSALIFVYNYYIMIMEIGLWYLNLDYSSNLIG